MRGKDFNAGLRGALFEAKHYERMGAAIWLYGWLVLRQTRQEGSTGWVLGGKPVSYREIEEETGFERKSLERWMQTLRRAGYIETRAAPSGVVVRITKAKKFSRPAAPHPGRFFEAGVRRNEEGPPQICGGGSADRSKNAALLAGIGSGTVVREEKDKSPGLEKNFREIRSDANAMPTRAANSTHAAEAANSWRGRKEELLLRELGAGEGPRLSPRRNPPGGAE